MLVSCWGLCLPKLLETIAGHGELFSLVRMLILLMLLLLLCCVSMISGALGAFPGLAISLRKLIIVLENILEEAGQLLGFEQNVHVASGAVALVRNANFQIHTTAWQLHKSGKLPKTFLVFLCFSASNEAGASLSTVPCIALAISDPWHSLSSAEFWKPASY